MSSFPPKSPYPGLPSSPRANRQMLSPLNTDAFHSATSSPSSEKGSPQTFVDTRTRRQESLIFANATIPLSPVSSTSTYSPDGAYEGVAPRKRSGFARLFSCLGREERARRRAQRFQFTEFEKVGDKCHWTEL